MIIAFLRQARRVVAPLAVFLLLGSFALPASAQGQYVIGSGDVLRIEVVEDEGLSRTVLVAPSGEITVPLAGSVRAAGRTLTAVQAALRQGFAPNFANPPTVFVALERQAQELLDAEPEAVIVSIYAIGEVGSPGRIDLAPGTTLLQALSVMGGFSPFAATDRIQLRRRDPNTGVEVIYPLQYDAILQGVSPNGGVVMAEGDVIVVPTRRLFE